VERLSPPASEIAFQSSNCWEAHAAAGFGMQVVWCNRYGKWRERLLGVLDREVTSLAELPVLRVPRRSSSRLRDGATRRSSNISPDRAELWRGERSVFRIVRTDLDCMVTWLRNSRCRRRMTSGKMLWHWPSSTLRGARATTDTTKRNACRWVQDNGRNYCFVIEPMAPADQVVVSVAA
jgi:hypothetical protein